MVGIAGCTGRETPLCALAARKVLHQVVYSEGEEEWRDQCLHLLPSVLVSHIFNNFPTVC